MNKRAKVENYPNLEKDLTTSAVVSTDATGYKKYIADRDARRLQNGRISELEDEIKELKDLIHKHLNK
jgi:hypothetical protein